MNAKRSQAEPLDRRHAVSNFDVREHLLDTATRLFAQRGIAATTIAQIAADADVASAFIH